MPLVTLKERLNGLIEGDGETGFGCSSTAVDVVEDLDLSDRTILVTGCNSGLGYETTRALASRSATVLGAARTEQKARHACESISGDTRPVVCDLEEPETILELADRIRSEDYTLDAIVCNAGVMALPELETVHGYEKQFFVDYVGHYLLVTELLDQLDNTGRVVLLSSAAHRTTPEGGINFENLSGENGYDPWTFYGQSKLAMLLMARDLGRRFEKDESSRTAYGVHPGVIHTNLTCHMNPAVEFLMSIFALLYLKSVPQGAATQTFAAVHPAARDYNGEHLADSNPRRSSEHGRDTQLATRLREVSDRIVEGFR